MLGYGEKTFAYFAAMFYSKFIAGSKCINLIQLRQYLYKNLEIMHDLFLKTFSKFINNFSYMQKLV